MFDRDRPSSSGAAPVSVAASVERLAVLLEAGVAPGSAWRHLADSVLGGAATRASRVADALAMGEPVGAAIAAADAAVGGSGTSPSVEAACWRQVVAVWEVAEKTGAPLAVSLRTTAESLRDLEQARRDADVALAGPLATSRVVLALPLVGVLLGTLLGFDSLAVLFTRPVGWLLLCSAAVLVALARAWNSRLVRRARPSAAVPGLELELLAVALGGGGSWASARRLVAETLSRHSPAHRGAIDSRSVDEVVELSERAGVPGAGLLRSAARERRLDARAAAAMATERLGVALMLPLGLCILPAFLLVAVVPLVVALLSSTGIGS